MRTIQQYMDQAIERQQLGSDRQLARLLDMSQVNIWRQGKSLPSEDAMLRLAELAGIDPQVALLELAFMRTEGPAREAYGELLKRIVSICGATVFGLSSLHPTVGLSKEIKAVNPSPAPVHECRIVSHNNVYYGKTRKWLNQFKQRLIEFFLSCVASKTERSATCKA